MRGADGATEWEGIVRTITWLGAAVALLAGSRKRLMRCLQVLTVAVPMVVALGCKDATAPLSRAARDIRASQAALVIPATTMQVSSGFQGTCALRSEERRVPKHCRAR